MKQYVMFAEEGRLSRLSNMGDPLEKGGCGRNPGPNIYRR